MDLRVLKGLFCLLSFLSLYKGLCQTGPGGVGDNITNKLWLKADVINGLNDGDKISTWADASGNANDGSQNGNRRPTYETGEINGLPVVRFDGSDDFFDNNHSYNARSVFIVYKVISTLQNSAQLGQVWGNYAEGVHVAMDPRSANQQGFSFDGNGSDQGKYAINGAAYGLFSANTNSSPWSYDQFQILAVEFDATRSITRQVIGSLVPAFSVGDHQFGGDIAEIIVYNDTLNDAQQIIVENYLSAKYGLSVINDKYTYEGSYGYEVAGIGREDSLNEHTAAASGKIFQVENPSSLNSGDYLLFGHNNGQTASWTTTGAPDSGNHNQRISCEWRLDETGDAGTLTLVLDTFLLPAKPSAYTRYVVWLDSDGDFTNGATSYILSLEGGVYKASGVDINDGDFITFGVVRPVISFSEEVSEGFENTTPANLEVNLNYILDADVSVGYTATDISATGGGADYNLPGGSLTIPAGSQTASISVEIINDTQAESDEQFKVTLSDPSSGITLGDDSIHTYTIHDDDNTRNIQFSAGSSSGNESTASVSVIVSVDQIDALNPATVDYSVTGGTATGGGIDYTLTSGTLTIDANDTDTVITFTVTDDALSENDETIIISLSNPVNANLGETINHIYTIVNDDLPPAVQFNSVSASGDEGSTPVSIQVDLSSAAGQDVTIEYRVTGGTATGGGADYTLSAGTLTITSGNTSADISLAIVDDYTMEINETIEITLSNPTGAISGSDSVFTFTIIDNDDMGFTGPGGVGDNNENELWLKADKITGLNDGDVVSSWADASGNSRNGTQNGSNRPTYETGEINGLPVVRFDGVNDYLNNAYSYNARTVFMVYKVSSALQSTSDLGQVWGNYGDGIHVALDARSANQQGFSFDGNGSTQAKYAILGATFGSFLANTNSVQWAYDQFEITAIEFNATKSMTRQVIGSLEPSLTGHNFGGDIAEIIVYNTTLNNTQKIILENYLAAKYGLTLSANDKYAFEGACGNDVAGIGREDASDFHDIAQSAGILTISEAGSLDDGDYLLWGHDNAGIASWSGTEVVTDSMKRITRKWQFDETGDVGTVTFTIDAGLLPARPSNYDEYVLLVDANGNFSTGATMYAMVPAGGNTYEASGIDIADGDFVTIAIAQKVSLQSGNFSNNSTWASGTKPNALQEVIILPNDIVTITTTDSIASMYVTSGGIFSMGAVTLKIKDGTITNRGTFNAGFGTIVYAKIGDQKVSDDLAYYYLNTEGSGTKSLTGDIDVIGGLTISGGSTLDTDPGNSFFIYLAGDWTNNGVFIENEGKLFFNGSSDQAIAGAGTQNFKNFQVNKNSGNIILGAPVEISGLLTLTKGDIQSGLVNLLRIADNANVTGASDNSHVNGPVRKTGDDNFTFPVGDGSKYRPIAMTVVSGSTITDEFTATFYNTSYANTTTLGAGLVDVSEEEHWILDRDAGSATLKVTLYNNFNSGIQSGYEDNIAVARWDGAKWVNEGLSSRTGDYTSGSFTSNNISSFSPFGFGDGGGGGALPIELLEFSAEQKEKSVELSWTTVSEFNNDYFEVERSGNGEYFETIGQVNGAGTTASLKQYSAQDTNPLEGVSYYRLKQTDFDGKYSYSKVVAVNFNVTGQYKLEIFPNPASGDEIHIMMNRQPAGLNISYRVYNLEGKIVAEGDAPKVRGNQITILPGQDLSSGMYFIRVKIGDQLFTEKLTIN